MRKTSPHLAGILLLLLLDACAGGPDRASDVRDYLEETTGTTVVYVATPAAFVSPQAGLASSGRDYIYLAPLTVSRAGRNSCWLWLGLWSTVDRQVRNDRASPLGLGKLQIVADGVPMDIDSRPVDPNPAGIGRIPYETPVAPAEELMLRVTRTQLQRLGRAHSLALVDRDDGGKTRWWRGTGHAIAKLRAFADATGAPDPESAKAR